MPLSHVFHNGKLYFHSALTGHKLDIIRQNDKVSFTVIAKDEIHPERYTTYFMSVIAFGKIRIVENDAEKRYIWIF
ncbi:MAG: pyridoxamine 5'-phosphate oxidase family protein [Muribaculaceae bacterium]|nr:pyridoxamine 5'-phosphate oxidase family protein [Muribaculaceae bacterium]